jgi:dsDNA-binding SOS-regulon protein
LKGKFQLKISESLQKSHRIEKYAQEPVAYFLHKKRDFLQRLFKTKAKMEDREIIEY